MIRRPALIALQFSLLLQEHRKRRLPLTFRQRLPRFKHEPAKRCSIADGFMSQAATSLEWGPFRACVVWANPKETR